jgi:hypothetical protein
MDYRVILYHKQATSARTRFLKFGHDSVLAFSPLPNLAQLSTSDSSDAVMHPAAAVQEVERTLGFDAGALKAEGEYHKSVEVPGGHIQVVLAAITSIDPPFDLAAKAGASFIDLTQARGLPRVELELLRGAYELILGG